MRHIKLNEEAIKQLENLLGEIPMKWASPIMNILAGGIEQASTDPAPPIGGGGGSAKPPKSE
jgi:hypothetical protein